MKREIGLVMNNELPEKHVLLTGEGSSNQYPAPFDRALLCEFLFRWVKSNKNLEVYNKK